MTNSSRSFIKALTISMLLACTCTVSAANHKGDTSLGPKVGYLTKNRSALVGIVFQHSFSDHFRLSPEISYDFRSRNLDAFIFDINAHVPFTFTGDRVDLYPLAGVTFNSWGIHNTAAQRAASEDVSTHVNRWGLNFGAGMDLRCTESLKLTLEARYSLVKSYSNVQISAGIAFVF